jgi:ABC-type polar amino acid transport system ATPase subunit
MKPIVEARGVHKHFGHLHVLKGVDLRVAERELVFVIGPSGSGKSTLLRCLNRLEEPSSGSVVVDGIDMLDPRVMLFDEPTSALDPELVGSVLEVMRNLRQSGMTMIVVSHEMGFARNAADRVVFMDDGLIVEQGPPAAIFENPAQERTRAFIGQIQRH